MESDHVLAVDIKVMKQLFLMSVHVPGLKEILLSKDIQISFPREGAPRPSKPIKHRFVIECRLGGGLQVLGCHPKSTVTAKCY